MAGTLARVLMANSAGLYPPMRKGIGRRPKRRTVAKAKAKRVASRKRAAPRKKARLVKGSMAAKRYMAKIRRKRR